MGEIRAKVRLENYADRVLFKNGRLAEKDIRAAEVEMMVDTGAVSTLLPQDLVEALGLETIDRVTASLADDRHVTFDRAGAFILKVLDRTLYGDCLVGPPGCEPLLGQTVMEELDLVANPSRRELTVDPASPYRPTLKMKKALLDRIPA